VDNEILSNFGLDECRLHKILGQARLGDLILARTKGVQLFSSNQLDSLSGGELQNLSFVRALSQKPDLSVLDEARSSLDISSESEVVKNVSNPHEECGRIIRLHDTQRESLSHGFRGSGEIYLRVASLPKMVSS
jgi:ABC-type transport system involved in cytochrome bd biosynthesis fused ATPase/permease subunit